MSSAADFTGGDFESIELPFVERGEKFYPSVQFGPRQLTVSWGFRTPPFDADGRPREVTKDEIVVTDNSAEMIPNYVVELPDDDEKTRVRNAQKLELLRGEVEKIPTRIVTLRPHQGRYKGSPESYNIAIVHNEAIIGSCGFPLSKPTASMLVRMEKAGFVFRTTAVVTIVESQVGLFNPGLRTGVAGFLNMPDLRLLKAYDPTEPGLFELDL